VEFASNQLKLKSEMSRSARGIPLNFHLSTANLPPLDYRRA
jgi:hypothetical protein